MDLLTLLTLAPGHRADAAASLTTAAAAVAGHLEAAVHAGVSSVPAVLGLCAAAGIAAGAAVVHQLQPKPQDGQVWVARRRDVRGIRVRITDAGVVSIAVVLTPPHGSPAADMVGAPLDLPARGRRVPGYRLQTEPTDPERALRP
jgi:hypothetical protein